MTCRCGRGRAESAGQRQRQKLHGCALAGRGGLAGDGKNCIHAGLVSRHPWRSTPPPTHPAPPSTGPWGPWGLRASVAPTHGRRAQRAAGGNIPPTMGRRYQGAVACREEGAPESGAAAKRRGVGASAMGPAVCAAKRGSDSANAMAWTRAMDGAKRGLHPCGFCRPPTSPTARPTQSCGSRATREGVSHVRPDYLLETYFSRRICELPRPASFSASTQASTMSGLPHR